jgi:hypothetical protein
MIVWSLLDLLKTNEAGTEYDTEGVKKNWRYEATQGDEYLSQTNPLPPRFASILRKRSISCLCEYNQNQEKKQIG